MHEFSDLDDRFQRHSQLFDLSPDWASVMATFRSQFDLVTGRLQMIRIRRICGCQAFVIDRLTKTSVWNHFYCNWRWQQ